MDYNTTREKLPLPEYGRNIQKMVDYLKTVTDRDKRNSMAKTIIGIMGSMHPHLRDVNDFKHKLWDHLAIMGNFELDIDSPYPPPDLEVLNEKPNPVPYNVHNITYKYYGNIIEKIINEAAKYEESEEKEELLKIIGNQMKKNYVMWNREDVSDEIIFQNIEELSNGAITVNKDIKLKNTRNIMPAKSKKKRSSSNKNNNHKSKRKDSKK